MIAILALILCPCISVLNINPLEAGDPQEIFGWFETNYDEITSSYNFSFIQESKYFYKNMKGHIFPLICTSLRFYDKSNVIA